MAFANALLIGSRKPVYVAGLLRREPRLRHHSVLPLTSRGLSALTLAPGAGSEATRSTTRSVGRGTNHAP